MPALLVVTPPGPEADKLCALLRGKGFEVTVAPSGADALASATRKPPDAILIDSALSAMDRWHAVKRLNTDPQTSRVPVLSLSSDAATGAGLQRVMVKLERLVGPVPKPPAASVPVPPASRATPVPVGAVAPRAPSPAAGRPAWRILVVDDNAMNRDTLGRRLQRAGYDVKVAESGDAALGLLARQPIDLVVLDWMMPGLSGMDVLRRIRASHAPIELPVIMATARSEAEDVVEALKAEANDFVIKPLNFDVVLARVQTQLNLVESHRRLAESERRFRALLENTGDMVVQFRADGVVSYVSPASRALLGFEPDVLVSRSFFEWLHPVDRRALEAQLRRALPPAFTFIARMVRQDRAWVWIETSCRVLREQAGAIVQAACRDVTEHMERLAGDEPPLPLGGDIMAHPGWRGAQAGGAAGEADPDAETPPSNAAASAQPVVSIVLLGDARGWSPDALSARITDELRRALGTERQ